MVKDWLTPEQRSATARINRAFASALDEMSLSLKPKSLLRSHTQTVAANTRSVTLSGENDDLRSIFAVKYGDNENQVVLTFVDPSKFLRNYDNPAVQADTPAYFTFLASVEGKPSLKFNCPTVISASLVVYYNPEMTPEMTAELTSVSTLANGTASYFFGAHTQEGQVYDAKFRNSLTKLLGDNTFLAPPDKRFGVSERDLRVKAVQWSLRNARSR